MTAGAHFQINQASNAVPTGTVDIARTDIKYGQPLHLVGDSSSGQVSPSWTLLAWAPGSARVQPTNRTTFDAAWTADVPGSYLGEFLVGDGIGSNRKQFVIACTLDPNGLIVDDAIREPVYGEQTGDDNAAGNDRGYAKAIESGMAAQVPAIATMANLLNRRAAKHKQVQLLGFYAPGDGGGGIFNWDASSTATHNGGTILQPGFGTGGAMATGRWIRQYSGPMHGQWFGVTLSAAVVHNANGTDTAKATTNKAAILAMGAALNAQGGGTGILPYGPIAMVVGTTCLHAVGWTDVTIAGHGAEVTLLFDPQVPAVVAGGAGAGAFLWLENMTRCSVIDLGYRGAADFPTQVAASITRIDRKGIYWQAPSTDCLTERVSFEGIEGEMWYVDGGVGAVATRNVARHIRWKDCITNAFNLASGSIYAVDCGVYHARGQNTGQSTAQMGGQRWTLSDIHSIGPTGNQLAADQILVENTIDFLIENVTIENFDISAAVVRGIVTIGFAGGDVSGTMRNVKINNCKISTDVASDNAIVNVRAAHDFGGAFGEINVAGVNIDGLEINGCSGITGTGGKVTGLRFNGPNAIDCTVSNLKIRNGPLGNLSQGVQSCTGVPANNKITLMRCSIDPDVPLDYKFNVPIRNDWASSRRITGATDADKLASVISLLSLHGLGRTGFLPIDFTTANVNGWYDAAQLITLGDTPIPNGTTPPVVTLTGALSQAIGLYIKIDDVSGGTGLGQAKFRWSLDNGSTWQATGVTTGADVTLGLTSIHVHFPAGPYNTNNIYEANVAIWGDLGPQGHDLTHPTKTKWPRFKVSQQNGKPGISTDGVIHYLTVAYTRPKPSFIYIVQRADSAATSGTICDGQSSNQTRFYRTGGTQLSMYSGTALNLPGADPEVFHIYRLKFAGASSYGKSDAATLASGATGANDAAAGFSIGAFNNASDFYKGTYLEMICLDAEPSAGEDAQMLAALQAKWAL